MEVSRGMIDRMIDNAMRGVGINTPQGKAKLRARLREGVLILFQKDEKRRRELREEARKEHQRLISACGVRRG
jgi:hypothetical protein